MMRTRVPMALVAIVALVLTAGCASLKSAPAASHPAEKLTPLGNGLTEVTLTSEVAQNIGVRTEPVRAQGSVLTVPTSAVIYRPEGTAWVYAEVRPYTYVRGAVTVADDSGGVAQLTEGPQAGTLIVVQGVSLIYGTEFKIGK